MFFRHIQALQPAHGGSFEALLRGLPGYCSVHIFDKVWGPIYSNPVIRCAQYLLRVHMTKLRIIMLKEQCPKIYHFFYRGMLITDWTTLHHFVGKYFWILIRYFLPEKINFPIRNRCWGHASLCWICSSTIKLLKYFQGFLKTRFNQEARPGFQSVLSELATTLPRFHFFFPLDARWKQWESSNMKETIVQITCRSPFYYNENLQKVLIAPNGFNTRMVRDISWDTTNTNTHTYSWTLWRVLREWLRQLDRL